MWIDRLLEKGLLPDFVIRAGIRSLNRRRLRAETAGGGEQIQERFQKLCAEIRKSPIAVHTRAANEQHYEVPPEFFQLCLGKNLKYSSCYFDEGVTDLSVAESRMLDLSIERAELRDGQSILELGCGWGSLTLAMARRFPRAKITAVSNSKPQRLFIESRLRAEGLRNVRVITADMNAFQAPGKYERIVSVEMFEHMRNYEALFQKVQSWLKPGGKLFVHIFNHRSLAYLFETEGSDNWMGRYFFTGGIMPSREMYLHFCHPLQIERIWTVDGVHYQKTSEAWLKNLDRHRDQVLAIFEKVYGDQAERWFHYWRVFYLAVAELFGMYRGQEWQVTHYRFVKAGAAARRR